MLTKRSAAPGDENGTPHDHRTVDKASYWRIPKFGRRYSDNHAAIYTARIYVALCLLEKILFAFLNEMNFFGKVRGPLNGGRIVTCSKGKEMSA